MNFRKIFNADGWINILKGVGSNDDARKGDFFAGKTISQNQIELLLNNNKIARKIVDKPILDMLREGIEIIDVNQDLKKFVYDEMYRLEVFDVLEKSLRCARGLGGALIIFSNSLDGGSFEYSFDYETGVYTIDKLIVLDRFQVIANSGEIDSDFQSRNFGLPVSYSLNTEIGKTGKVIHNSRYYRMIFDEYRGTNKSKYNYFGVSIFEFIYNSLKSYEMSLESIDAIMRDVTKTVVQINDLGSQLSQGNDDAIITRLQILKQASSVLNFYILSENEKIETKTTQTSGISDIVNLLKDKICTDSDMPHTILFNEGAKGGINNNGDSEKNDWYEHVRSLQEQILRPFFDHFFQIILNQSTSKFKKTKLKFKFNPLKIQSEKELAETRLTMARADEIYIERGVLSPEQIAKARFGDEYSIETSLDDNEI